VIFRTPSQPSPEPAKPDLDEAEEARSSFASVLLMMREGLTPAFDAADGMRADLIARGWSAQCAEILAMTWLQRVLTHVTPLGGIQ
jgi:hypothetical protein